MYKLMEELTDYDTKNINEEKKLETKKRYIKDLRMLNKINDESSIKD